MNRQEINEATKKFLDKAMNWREPEPAPIVTGVSLRMLTAMQAMIAYTAYLASTGQTVSKCYAEIAEESFRMADALIAAEGKEGA